MCVPQNGYELLVANSELGFENLQVGRLDEIDTVLYNKICDFFLTKTSSSINFLAYIIGVNYTTGYAVDP